ncbi:MAG TPA: acyl-CoA dehydrogenase family protein [Gemmatimonadales bacterium]|nr:acyl-CoA dehydrogenase family protein [Gemmatimonadales bacterium]
MSQGNSNDTPISFARGLFAGVVQHHLLFPYPKSLEVRNPDEAREVRRLIRELRRMQGDIIDSERIDDEERVPEEVITAFAEIGMLGLTIPREYGGLELSSAAYARVFSALSTVDASLAVLVGVHCGLGSRAIALFGSREQRQRYLPLLASGRELAAYALTEPETGSDAQNIVSHARQEPDGSWVLNGRKLWIGNGHRAGVIATFAQTEVERNGKIVRRPTAFIIRPDMPGFSVEGTVRKLGIRGSTQAELSYDNLRVPADHVLGQVGKGFSVAVHVLNGGRLTLAAGCTGASRQVVEEMVRFAEWRVQFGQPIASFEITQRKLAQLASEVYAADAMLGELVAAADQGDSDIALEAAIAKVFASELVWRATDEMVQVAGGRGYVKPYPYERMLRDARINRIFEGTNEILRLFIGLNGVQGPAEKLKEIGTAMRRPLRNLGLVSGYAASRVKSAVRPSAEMDAAVHVRLEEHRKYFLKHVAELSAATDRAIRKYRTGILERQLVVERLANMAIELYATACVLARTQALLDDRGLEQCSRELALCDLFCVEAGRRFRSQRLALDSREEDVDDTRRDIAAAVREERRYWVPDSILEELANEDAQDGAETNRQSSART